MTLGAICVFAMTGIVREPGCSCSGDWTPLRLFPLAFFTHVPVLSPILQWAMLADSPPHQRKVGIGKGENGKRSATGLDYRCQQPDAGQFVIRPTPQPPLGVCFVGLHRRRSTRSQVCFYSLHTPPSFRRSCCR